MLRVLAITGDIMFKWRLLVGEDRKARVAFFSPWVDPLPESS